MAKDRWSAEKAAIFLAEVNTRVLPRAMVYLVVTLPVMFGVTYFFGDGLLWKILFPASLLSPYPIAEYSVVLYSTVRYFDLAQAREMFFADRAGYRAKLKVTEGRLYQPTKNQKAIAWGLVLLAVVALAWSLLSHG